MILLFEDRKERANVSSENFDKSIFSLKTFDFKGKEGLAVYIEQLFGRSEAVIFHVSYTFSSDDTNIEHVHNTFKQLKIPIVLFGGGIYNNVKYDDGYCHGTANSDSMYSNLSTFVEHYKSTNEVDIRILVFGAGYLYNSLLNLQKLIYTNYFYSKGSDIIDQDSKESLVAYLIEPSIREKEFYNDKTVLLDWILNDLKPITVFRLKSTVRNLIERYRLNILNK